MLVNLMREFDKKTVSITVDVSYWVLIMLSSLLKFFFLGGGRRAIFLKYPEIVHEMVDNCRRKMERGLKDV